MGGGGFTPDPERLYEVGRDGRPYTLGPVPAGLAERLERRVRRWWAASILLNAATMGLAAASAMLAPRAVAAWFGALALLTAPTLLVAPFLRHRAPRGERRVHRARPDGFPPPPIP